MHARTHARVCSCLCALSLVAFESLENNGNQVTGSSRDAAAAATTAAGAATAAGVWRSDNR